METEHLSLLEHYEGKLECGWEDFIGDPGGNV